MGTSAALNIAAAAGGITEGIRTGLLLKEDKRRDRELEDEDAFDAAVKAYYGEKSGSATVPEGERKEPADYPNPGHESMQGVKTPGAEGEAKPDADGFTYNPAKYSKLPDSMKGLRDEITEYEDLAKIALQHGKTKEAAKSIVDPYVQAAGTHEKMNFG
jgi:hypothetical protein